MRHPLLRLLGGGVLLGTGCILVLQFSWLDYLLEAVSGPGLHDPDRTRLDWFALRVPYLVAALVGGLGGGFLGRRGGWLAGVACALECFLLSFLHFTLAGANFVFLVSSPALADGMALAVMIAAGAGVVGEYLARSTLAVDPVPPAPA